MNTGVEIERKFLVDLNKNPYNLNTATVHHIEQAYLCTGPVVRVRKDDENYYLTYKSNKNHDNSMLARDEYNLPLTKEAYHHLKEKADGNIITKKRYILPIDNELIIELDVFEGVFDGLVLAEVEFPSIEAANSFIMPDWFTKDVTYDSKYYNSVMSMHN